MNDYTKCKKEKWAVAQKSELNIWTGRNKDGDDWNSWWASQFNSYNFLKDRNINSILEVGCGPYARNTKIILNILENKVNTIDLLDPLLQKYINDNLSVTQLIKEDTKLFDLPLEEFTDQNEKYDLIICINVFDHVYDSDLCINNIYNSLKEKGIVIIGQDLTNEEDLKNEIVLNDHIHPIKLDHLFFEKHLKKYSKHIFNKILDRYNGRNPSAHYGTLLYAGEK